MLKPKKSERYSQILNGNLLGLSLINPLKILINPLKVLINLLKTLINLLRILINLLNPTLLYSYAIIKVKSRIISKANNLLAIINLFFTSHGSQTNKKFNNLKVQESHKTI